MAQHYRVHRHANVFPLMPEATLNALTADIRAHGLRRAIVLYEGRVLDGRNRLKACRLAGVKPRFERYTGDDPLSYVISANMHRRDLTQSQRAMIHVNLLPAQEAEAKDRQRQGRARLPSAKVAGRARDHVASAAGVSGRYIADAKKIKMEAPDIVGFVWDGTLTIPEAKFLLKLPKAGRGKVVSQKRVKPTLNISLAVQAYSDKQILRKATNLANVQGRYSCILADPPWAERPSGNRPPTYPRMTMEELKALPLAQKAADDSILFLWTTSGRLPDALELMRSWGFTYRRDIMWCKEHRGLGHWARTEHEQLLIGTRGNLPAPFNKPGSVIHAPVRAHSQKPDEIYDVIEGMYPGVKMKRLEMFARTARDGWTAWGCEAPKHQRLSSTLAEQVAA